MKQEMFEMFFDLLHKDLKILTVNGLSKNHYKRFHSNLNVHIILHINNMHIHIMQYYYLFSQHINRRLEKY
jgi:hypothetical protein